MACRAVARLHGASAWNARALWHHQPEARGRKLEAARQLLARCGIGMIMEQHGGAGELRRGLRDQPGRLGRAAASAGGPAVWGVEGRGPALRVGVPSLTGPWRFTFVVGDDPSLLAACTHRLVLSEEGATLEALP